jgi:hypothetical protein
MKRFINEVVTWYLRILFVQGTLLLFLLMTSVMYSTEETAVQFIKSVTGLEFYQFIVLLPLSIAVLFTAIERAINKLNNI